MKNLISFIVLFVAIRSNYGANILMLSGIPSPSHFIFNKALAEGLALRGHNLTIVSPDVEKNPPQNIHYIHLEQIYSHYYNGSEHVDLLEMAKESVLKSVFSFYNFGAFMCEGVALSKGLDVIRNYPDDFKFDLVINDFTCGPCLLGLLPKFKYPPLIGVSAFNNPPYTVDIVGGDKLGLTAKPFYLLNYDNDMNALQRIHNGVIHFMDSMYRKYSATPDIDAQMKKIFGSDLPYADELDERAVLMLVNSNPAVDYPDSLPPNIVQVGGLQIKAAKPAPAEFDEFLKKGKKGAVLMSLGTNVRSDEIGQERINMVLEAFRQIPDYNFVWKFETSEMLKNLPANVKISDWLPQNDLLAHSSLKLFITHAGLLSTHESTWWGVPMVGIPLLADQHRNLHKSVSAGVAVKVDFLSLTTEKLKNAINEVLNNSKYAKNMKTRSKRFRDQPEKPLERAVWWTEYIIRDPKAAHLQPAKFSFGLLGSHFWDIQLLLVIVLLGIGAILKRVLKKYFTENLKVNEKKKNN